MMDIKKEICKEISKILEKDFSEIDKVNEFSTEIRQL